MSDSSDEEKNYGNTTPHGPAARGKTHKCGNSKGTCTLGSISSPVNQQPVNQPSATRPMDKKTSQIGYWSSRVMAHWPPVKWALHRNFLVRITGHQSSSHRSLDLENFNTGENQYSPATGNQTLYQPIVSATHAMGMEFTNNPASSKRVLLPLEPDFINMSDPSLIVEPRHKMTNKG